MGNIWLTKLNYHASTVQKATEKVLSITKLENFNEQRAQIALNIVRDGQVAFQAFSNEIRDADLNGPYYEAASEVDDAWSNLVQLLMMKLLQHQSGDSAASKCALL